MKDSGVGNLGKKMKLTEAYRNREKGDEGLVLKEMVK